MCDSSSSSSTAVRPLYTVNGCAKASSDAPATHDVCDVKAAFDAGKERPARRSPLYILTAVDFILKGLQCASYGALDGCLSRTIERRRAGDAALHNSAALSAVM